MAAPAADVAFCICEGFNPRAIARISSSCIALASPHHKTASSSKSGRWRTRSLVWQNQQTVFRLDAIHHRHATLSITSVTTVGTIAPDVAFAEHVQ